MSSSQPSELSSSLAPTELRDELYSRGSVLYEVLREQLERESLGKYIAIHVDTGDYEVAASSSLATRGILQRHNRDGRLFGRRIGDAPEYGLAARIFGPRESNTK